MATRLGDCSMAEISGSSFPTVSLGSGLLSEFEPLHLEYSLRFALSCLLRFWSFVNFCNLAFSFSKSALFAYAACLDVWAVERDETTGSGPGDISGTGSGTSSHGQQSPMHAPPPGAPTVS